MSKEKSIWCKKLDQSKKFLEKSRNHGRKVYGKYEDNRDPNQAWIKQANFFYANVNIIKESLFNSLPKPDVSRVQKANFIDDASRVAALIVSRGLTYEVNCAPNFEEAITNAIIERLVPGTGQVWLRFEVEQQDETSLDEEGKEVTRKVPVPGTEQIHVDQVFWEDFFYGPAKKWSEVPWVARAHHFTEKEITDRWGPDAMSKVGSDKNNKTGDNLVPKEIDQDKYCVYEIWDKKSRKVIFMGEGGDQPLETRDDPLKLLKFFPCPRPMIANVNTTKFLPVTDYYLAQDQYEVLNVLYGRINQIVKAIKVAGIYNGASMDIQRMLTAGENVLIPVDNWAMMAENGGVAGQIEWYPVEKVATVLQMLQAQFEAAKAMLYEITGMSDILRGSSNPYETKGAQQIKAQFASVRMNGTQREVAVFVRDTLRIISELMTQLYSDEKLAEIVGELPPPDQQFVSQAMAILRDDFMTKYKVNIQANSLTQADWALEKEQRLEMVQTLGQMIQGVMQGAEAAPELAVLGVQMIKFAISGFKGATEFEGYIDKVLDDLLRKQQEAQMNPQPPKPSPEEQKAQMEMQKMQMQGQMDVQKTQMEMQSKEADNALQAQKLQMEMQFREREMQMKLEMMQAELMHRERMYELETRMKLLELQLKGAQAEQNLQVTEAKNEQAVRHGEEKHEIAKEQAAKEKPEPKKDK